MVFFRFPFHNDIQQMSFDNDLSVPSTTIYQHISTYLGSTDFSLIYNGKALPKGENIPQDANILVTFSLPGGKGGFGSMLRAIGAQIEKTTNREACRDLSGRRLRDINEEQRLKKWISKESEREAEKGRRRQARLERLKAKPRHQFNDFEYEKKLSEGPDRVEEALAAGMEKRNKRAAAPEASCSSAPPKKKHLWLEDDISCSSDSETEASGSCSATAAEGAGCSSSTSDSQNSGDSSDVKPASSSPQSPAVCQEDTPKEKSTEADPSSLAENLPSSSCSTVVSPSTCSAVVSSNSCSAVTQAIEEEVDVDLDSLEGGPSSLEALGLDTLKRALAQRGLKCGGSLQDRARRLWEVRGLLPHQYPAHSVAKKKK